jgi:Family of unknown function (DUF6526)
MAETQNYSNHIRWFPLFHFFLVPVLLLNFLYAVLRLYQEPNRDHGVWAVMSLVFILILLASRLQALKAQDRVIRLEEKLRYKEVLSPELNTKAADLSLAQIIALRFASNEELPGLAERTLNGEFHKTKEIKLAIKNWRGDYYRV